MPSKAHQRMTIVEYLADPENPFLNRAAIATELLGYTTRQTLYKIFDAKELNKIEAEAIAIRRTRYTSSIARVDAALIKAAEAGNTQAIQLCYQKFENWAPRTKKELTGNDGKPIEIVERPKVSKEEWLKLHGMGEME